MCVLLQIEILDEDNFLGRAGGSRGKLNESTCRKESHALMHYLPKLDKDVFCAFHAQFSEDPEVSMFAMKVLSIFMGYIPLQMNTNKILLIERAAAFRIFGQAPRFNSSRSGYFLCYSSYALAAKDKDVKLLAGYKRRKYLRYRGSMPEESDVKKLKN